MQLMASTRKGLPKSAPNFEKSGTLPPQMECIALHPRTETSIQDSAQTDNQKFSLCPYSYRALASCVETLKREKRPIPQGVMACGWSCQVGAKKLGLM